MFYESIASETANHLREHIKAYLDEISASFVGSEKLTLRVPDISSATLVGGIMQAPIEQLPALGVDCVEKQQIDSNESLCYYQYTGAIAGLISGSSSSDVDKLAKRHAAAVEKFVRNHQFLHLLSTLDYTMREFLYVNTNFSGAIELDLEDEKPLWVDGFTMNVIWVVSEDNYRQHQ